MPNPPGDPESAETRVELSDPGVVNSVTRTLRPGVGEYEVPGPVPARDLLARERGTQLSVGAALPLTGGVLSR